MGGESNFTDFGVKKIYLDSRRILYLNAFFSGKFYPPPPPPISEKKKHF